MLNSSKDRNKARTAHYISCWGVPDNIFSGYNIEEIELAIFEFAPHNNRLTWRYVTNGMSEFLQNYENNTIRTELYVSTNNSVKWALPFLTALAKYPYQNKTYFADYDTIPIGKSIGNNNSPFSAVLLAPFYVTNEDEENMGEIDKIFDNQIFINFVVPIYENECNFAIENGGETLWKKLLSSKYPLELDAKRPSICGK